MSFKTKRFILILDKLDKKSTDVNPYNFLSRSFFYVAMIRAQWSEKPEAFSATLEIYRDSSKLLGKVPATDFLTDCLTTAASLKRKSWQSPKRHNSSKVAGFSLKIWWFTLIVRLCQEFLNKISDNLKKLYHKNQNTGTSSFITLQMSWQGLEQSWRT